MRKMQFDAINVLETTWNDNDCCLNVVIGSQ